MNFASWNMRGFNKAPHQKELQHFLSMNKIDLMGVLETKVEVSNALGISKKITKIGNGSSTMISITMVVFGWAGIRRFGMLLSTQ